MISNNGIVYTHAGTGATGGVNGPANAATFMPPWSIMINTNNNAIYVSEQTGYRIRKILP